MRTETLWEGIPLPISRPLYVAITNPFQVRPLRPQDKPSGTIRTSMD